ncbi:hypothetical protein HYV30_04415 [Candidatus Kaiserbacteria bacterium]|nr:hypothetical protein [Candidatus Kaiserbacteria bacterium]
MLLINDLKLDLAELHIPRWFSRVPTLYKAWMLIALVLGWFVFRFLLLAVYAIVILPMGLLFRLFGKDPLDRQIAKNRPSYWLPVSEESRENSYSKKF